MEATFWHDRWESNQIAFHEGRPNPLLVAHIDALGLQPGARVFVPLCGKTADIPWLLSQGFRVAGAELSEIAIRQLFDDLGRDPLVTPADEIDHHATDDIDVFVGDIFELTQEHLGPVDAVYDRAALVALPADMRRRYARYLAAITGRAPQLVITYEYDQRTMDGPPFSVSEAELRDHYGADYEISGLFGEAVPGGLKGKYPARESLWHLRTAVS